MVFVHVVFVVTLKLHRQGKKVSLPSLKFCHIFFSSEYRSYSVFVSLLCDMWHNILHFPSSSSCHSIQDTAVEQTHAARIEEKPSMPNVTCLTTGQHLVLLWKKSQQHDAEWGYHLTRHFNSFFNVMSHFTSFFSSFFHGLDSWAKGLILRDNKIKQAQSLLSTPQLGSAWFSSFL